MKVQKVDANSTGLILCLLLLVILVIIATTLGYLYFIRKKDNKNGRVTNFLSIPQSKIKAFSFLAKSVKSLQMLQMKCNL